jgi:hypothetical protein
MSRLWFAATTLFAMLALCALLTQPLAQQAPSSPPGTVDDAAAPEIRALRADAVAVRLMLGVGDTEPQAWDGKVTIDQGEIVALEGARFRTGDAVTGPDSWKARSAAAATKGLGKGAGKGAFKKGNFAKKAGLAKKGAGGAGALGLNPGGAATGLIVHAKAPGTATLTINTEQGQATIALADLAASGVQRLLGGRIEARRVPVHAAVTATRSQEDFPAAAPDGRDGAWVVYVSHESRGPEGSPNLAEEPENFKGYVPSGGGDQVKLVHYSGTAVDRMFDVTDAGLDVWRPAVAREGQSGVVVVWSEFRDGNWDLYARRLDGAGGAWAGRPQRLTSEPGSDTDAVLATGADGAVWMAWQAWRNGQADIYLAPVDDPSRTVNVSDHPADDWSPSLAIGPQGRRYVAFDSYRSGSFDVLLYRDGNASGNANKSLITIAGSTRFEARPSVAVDARSRAWVAYEERGDNWGKDFGVHTDKQAVPLYRTSAVRVACLDGDQVYDTGDPVARDAAPGAGAGPGALAPLNSYPRLALDRGGRPWLVFRRRQPAGAGIAALFGGVGTTWLEYATARVGDAWMLPQPLPRSDNLLDNRPALVPQATGRVLAFYSSDGRLHRERAAGAQAGGPNAPAPKSVAAKNQAAAAVVRRTNNDIFVAALATPAGGADPTTGAPAVTTAAVAPAHASEAEDVARIRAHRVSAGGKTYQLLRGEFHRHTDISPDGGGDGTLEDMWRYGLDVAALDWIGCGDHDNGNGREYTWWITQKTTDLYHIAPRFNPMFTYERSVNYPGGHRNVMFAERGVRTLPRLMGDSGVRIDEQGRDLDVAMLYKYLRELSGICAAHTTATTMGTDWRANDPQVEPFVEIYQGDRDSYESFGAPRVAHGPGDAVGGWRPLGMVWNALALQYRLGFQSSSDHISTHISFAVAIAEAATRAAIFDAFQKRHCYAATDNIVLEVRAGDHLMGDEFTTDGPVTLRVLAHGTGPIKRVDIIKDFHHVYSAEPGKARVEFSWTDEDGVNRGPSWYYVRVVQADGEIAWGSPMWVNRPAPAATQ